MNPERRGRRRPLLVPALLALVAGLSVGGGALAATGKSTPLPIHIQSDHADFAQKSGESTYTGHVQLTRGGLTLTGTKLVVTQLKNHSQIHAVLTGNPVHINKKPDSHDDQTITGHADRVIYDNASATITLRGNAELTRQGGDQIHGAVITHNLNTGATDAQRGQGKNGQQVHITIAPKNSSSQ